MSLRPPDWERRLRDLERRADNRGTDIVRLWGRLPQAPELPGYAMPVIIPSSTTPTPTTTTTTTSTTSTTTSSTTTSSTTTTSPGLSCYSYWPQSVTLVTGQFTASPGTGSAIVSTMDGTFNCVPFGCNWQSSGAAKTVFVYYQGPVTYPAGGDLFRWRVLCYLDCDSFSPGPSSIWGSPSNVWYFDGVEVRYAGFIASATTKYIQNYGPSYGTGSNASILLGDTYSVQFSFSASAIGSAPSSVSIDFSSSMIP